MSTHSARARRLWASLRHLLWIAVAVMWAVYCGAYLVHLIYRLAIAGWNS